MQPDATATLRPTLLKRSIACLLALSTNLVSAAYAEPLDWRSVGLRKNVVLCAALFEVRDAWMIDAGMDESAVLRELNASLDLQGIYQEQTLSFVRRPRQQEDPHGPPRLLGPLPTKGFEIEQEVRNARERLRLFFLATGELKHRP